MYGAYIEAIAITGGILVWIGVFVASWQGKLGVSWVISDGFLAFLAVMVAYRLWRICCRRGQTGA
jgi:membrane protein implicated in regulation of membrane protease activity